MSSCGVVKEVPKLAGDSQPSGMSIASCSGMSMPKDELQAAPPDDGGHVGSYTLPSDVLQIADPDEPKSPALHRDQERPSSGSQNVRWIIWGGVFLLGAVGIIFGLR